MMLLFDLTISGNQLKSGHLPILLTSNTDDHQNQTKVILCFVVIFHLLLFNVLLLQHKTKMKIQIVEDSTGDK